MCWFCLIWCIAKDFFILYKKFCPGPITFVLSEGNDLKSVKNGLFEGKTMVWYKDLIIGKQENLVFLTFF